MDDGLTLCSGCCLGNCVAQMEIRCANGIYQMGEIPGWEVQLVD
jgi:hypothetical protein